MSSDIAPAHGFRYRWDAERAQRALILAGIDSTIREPEDTPPGWRMAPSELRFTIWLARDRLQEAKKIIADSWPQADTVTCSRCGATGPTVHITSFMDGKQVVTHLCPSCHSQTS
jgi:hypothetical protein